MADSVFVINRGLEQRTSKTGRRRSVIRIDAEPMLVNMDPKSLGKPIAEAIANHLRERIRGITAQAAPATIAYRKRAAKALADGKAWAVKRYGGGRIGSLPPNQSDRLFNDSERMANSIVANASNDNSWRVNVAGNRLDESTAGASGVERIWTRLVQLVPEFGNIALLFEGNAIARRTLERVAQERIQVGKKAASGLSQFQAFVALRLFG
jgi:hypothetical protein